MSYVHPPPRLPAILRIALRAVEHRLGGSLLASRILAWYPRALQGRVPLDEVTTFSPREKAALRYVQGLCRTPLELTSTVLEEMKRSFSPRGFVIVASTCAQVNFWTRLIQGLGVPPAGFSGDCPLLDLDAYTTLKRR